jgi:CRISPR/Cas system-associated protein Csm6
MVGPVEKRIGDVVSPCPFRIAAEILTIARQADEEQQRLRDHVDNLQRMNEGHCARINAQHEVIQKLNQELADERKKRRSQEVETV